MLCKGNEMSKSLCATLSAIVDRFKKNEHILYFKQIETSYPVTIIWIAKVVTGQPLMTILKHVLAYNDDCDGLYAVVLDMNTNFRPENQSK